MNDNIEKARQVGDMHPTKPYVWTEYKPGKFDWRPTKSPAQPSASGATPAAASKPTATQIATAKVKSGKPMSNADLLAWAKKTDEKSLMTIAGSEKGNAQMRKIAYDELLNRGVDIDSINTKGSLDQLLNMTNQQPYAAPIATAGIVDVDGEDTGGVISEKWYLNPDDRRVKKMFDLSGKEGRVKYDQFVYKMKKKEKDYLNPIEVVQDLNEQYLEFLDNDEQRFMISAGGAGIGKTYGFMKLAELLNKKPFEEGDTPGDGDYDIFEAPDLNSGKQLLSILKAHNGKIILFDDNDKVLRRSDCAAPMKKACATTGKRILGDPDNIKSNFEFTGRIIIMTNKDLNVLSENEDTKAIISRAMMTSEIYLTVPETIEVMKQRFQNFEFKQAKRLPDVNADKQERQDVLDLIIANEKNIDPAQFTTRTFQEILLNKRLVEGANAKRKNPGFADYIGSKEKDWKTKAVATITKAYTPDFGKTLESSDEIIKALDDETKGDALEKADDFYAEDMTLEKAEEMLLAEGDTEI